MRVYSNTAISLDGRIGTPAFDHVVLGTKTDRDYMSVLRARADAVLVGGRTFRNWPLPLVPDPKAIARLKEQGFPDTDIPVLEGRQWWNVVLSRGLELPKTGRFYEDKRVKPLFLSQVSGEMPGELESTAKITVPWILSKLQKRGIETLLIEGGGDLLAQFVEADALHELYITLCPKLVGGKGAPTLLDGPGFLPKYLPQLELLSCHTLQSELYLHYRVCR
jgi:5-amino-6-(5-phosphoribosylamino)uracil reductase